MDWMGRKETAPHYAGPSTKKPCLQVLPTLSSSSAALESHSPTAGWAGKLGDATGLKAGMLSGEKRACGLRASRGRCSGRADSTCEREGTPIIQSSFLWSCVENDKLRGILNTWVKPAGTRGPSSQGGRRLGLLSEIVGRNPPFPGGGPAEDLAEPPAAATLLPHLEHGPLLEAAGVFVTFKVGHGHIQVLRAVGTGEGGCSHFLPVLSDLAHHPWPQPTFASNVIWAP